MQSAKNLQAYKMAEKEKGKKREQNQPTGLAQEPCKLKTNSVYKKGCVDGH